jgi:AcrR family transcriptional regulator
METRHTEIVSLVLPPNFEDLDVQHKIVEKAEELCRRMGFRAMTMSELSAQLGMSKKTLYQYFADKQAIVDAVVSKEILKTQEECRLAANTSLNAIDEIFITLDYITKDFQDVNPIIMYELQRYYPATFQRFSQHKNTFIYNTIATNLQKGIEEKLYRPDIHIDILTKFRLESIFMAFDQQIFPSPKYQLITTSQVLIEHLLYGIVTEQGFALINEYKNNWKNK